MAGWQFAAAFRASVGLTLLEVAAVGALAAGPTRPPIPSYSKNGSG